MIRKKVRIYSFEDLKNKNKKSQNRKVGKKKMKHAEGKDSGSKNGERIRLHPLILIVLGD